MIDLFWPSLALGDSYLSLTLTNQSVMMYRGRNQRKGDHEDSDFHEEDHHMTEAQKEEEQLIK